MPDFTERQMNEFKPVDPWHIHNSQLNPLDFPRGRMARRILAHQRAWVAKNAGANDVPLRDVPVVHVYDRTVPGRDNLIGIDYSGELFSLEAVRVLNAEGAFDRWLAQLDRDLGSSRSFRNEMPRFFLPRPLYMQTAVLTADNQLVCARRPADDAEYPSHLCCFGGLMPSQKDEQSWLHAWDGDGTLQTASRLQTFVETGVRPEHVRFGMQVGIVHHTPGPGLEMLCLMRTHHTAQQVTDIYNEYARLAGEIVLTDFTMPELNKLMYGLGPVTPTLRSMLFLLQLKGPEGINLWIRE